jgi:hypothetical protein
VLAWKRVGANGPDSPARKEQNVSQKVSGPDREALTQILPPFRPRSLTVLLTTFFGLEQLYSTMDRRSQSITFNTTRYEIRKLGFQETDAALAIVVSNNPICLYAFVTVSGVFSAPETAAHESPIRHYSGN